MSMMHEHEDTVFILLEGIGEHVVHEWEKRVSLSSVSVFMGDTIVILKGEVMRGGHVEHVVEKHAEVVVPVVAMEDTVFIRKGEVIRGEHVEHVEEEHVSFVKFSLSTPSHSVVTKTFSSDVVSATVELKRILAPPCSQLEQRSRRRCPVRERLSGTTNLGSTVFNTRTLC